MSFKSFVKRIFGRQEKVVYIKAKDLADVYYTHFSGRVCNICKEPYVGVAQDCRCTNYGE